MQQSAADGPIQQLHTVFLGAVILRVDAVRVSIAGVDVGTLHAERVLLAC